MNITKNLCLIAISATFVISCNKKEDFSELEDPILTHRDTTINPADDFFNYANGRWFKENPIPASERGNGIFHTIEDTVQAQIRKICETSAKETNAKKGSNIQKIGDFYASGMDTIAIEKAGLNPLKLDLMRIEDINDTASLFSTIGYLHTMGVTAGFTLVVSQDDKISSQNALVLWQGGLGLDNRDYYFNTDAETANIRAEYVKHLEAMAKLAGTDATTAKKEASTVMKFETDLAKASLKMEALRDPVKNYNKMTLAQLQKLTPNIDWAKALPAFGIAKADSIIVSQPGFYANLDKMVKSYSISDWKVYLKSQLLAEYGTYLSKNFRDEIFHFRGTVMNGITEQKPRWKKITDHTNDALGELIGQIYVADYLPKGSKEKLLEIGNNIRTVYAEHIKNLDWMSEPTKKKALKKLDKIVMKVGYPDEWKDLSSLEIRRDSYCTNVMASNRWEYNEMISKYGKPVDRKEWSIFPQTYNAYYNPSNNEIVIPACNILVPGFEGRMPDDAVLYGIIGGSTFGHEITHGFDDQGSQYDENGNLNNWWTAEDLAKFQAKTKLIVAQYSKFEPLPGKFVNGDATQGENIADLGGVVMGLEAFKKTEQYKSNEKIGGFTPEQRYFLAYGYAWLINYKKETLAMQIMTDVHSPAQYRVNGVLANLPEFHKAFNVKPGDKMYQPDSLRVVIW